MEDFLDIDFNMYGIGRDYYREGKKCVLDPIREILVIETPEEIIRQRFIKYLIHQLEVPENKIGVEVPMTRFRKGARGRADIIVYGENEDGDNVPLIIIECKAPTVSLIDEVWFQAYRYDDILGTGFIIITNGNLTYAAVYNEEDEQYYFIEELPKYKQLLEKEEFIFRYNDYEGWKRPDFSDITTEKTINSFLELGWIGEGTNESLYPFIVNLVGFIQDTDAKIAPVNLKGLKIIEDGDRYTSFGNAAGGTWEGDYRYFILEDEEGNHQIISISILGSLKCTNHPKFGNRKGHTTLVVAIDDFDKRHNSLQLNIDRYTEFKEGVYTVWHDGTLTVGKSGAVKRTDVIDYIKSQEPLMVNSEGRIVLGTFDGSKEILWSQKNVKQFIKNIIKYAILRDEFRRIKQSE